MKVNGSSSLDPSLIEQMQKAHSSAKTQEAAPAFSTEGAAQVAPPASTPPPSQGVNRVAGRVLSGEISDPVEARREVVVSLVDERFGAIVPAGKKRQAVSMLEDTLLEDPNFAKEVDQMLLMAARDLGAGGR